MLVSVKEVANNGLTVKNSWKLDLLIMLTKLSQTIKEDEPFKLIALALYVIYRWNEIKKTVVKTYFRYKLILHTNSAFFKKATKYNHRLIIIWNEVNRRLK